MRTQYNACRALRRCFAKTIESDVELETMIPGEPTFRNTNFEELDAPERVYKPENVRNRKEQLIKGIPCH
jgi:hypothetical protein